MKTQPFNGVNEYCNPRILGVNKEEAHFEGLGFLSESDLDQQLNKTSISLNGKWKFKLYRHPDEVDQSFHEVDNCLSDSWDEITVPGVWEFQGYGTPYYLAISYPPHVDVRKHKIPSLSKTDNPTGAYVSAFTLPDDFLNQHVFIRFGAVKSAFWLWINGIQVGFSKASMTSHEFEITPYLKAGQNKVAVLVVKYSDGTYLEGQDMWYLGGITRDVTVFSEPQTYLYDAFASSDLIHDYQDASFKLDLTFKGQFREDLALKVVLSYQNDQVIYHEALDSLTCHVERLIEKPALWSAETPYLYVVKLMLYSGKTLIQAKQFRFGFRSIEIKDTRFLINGRPIKFKGVNRHDFDPEKAWGIAKETRLTDLLIMKAHNINAIRTAHYPNHPHLYDLADELGFYVIDEADLESHGVRQYLPKNDPLWEKAGIDRNQRLVLRDRNHPCIVMWSLGNEAGEGSSFMAMRHAIKVLDPTRPIHYEGDKQPGLSDVYSMMYPSPELERKFGEKQDIQARGLLEKATQLFLTRKPVKKEAYQDLPIMNCEYAHCMENSLGNFQEHVDNFEKYDNWIGGFIWDFVDLSIKKTDPEGKVKWLYGGDFGEDKTDAFFCANGLIAADRSLHPAITEVKQVYANLSISDYNPIDHTVLIKNKNVFIDTDYVLFIAKLLSNGIMIDQAVLHVDPIPAGQGRRILVPDLTLPNDNTELILEIDAVEKTDRPWAKLGHEICFGQFILRPALSPDLPNDLGAAFRVAKEKGKITFYSPALTVSLDPQTGAIERVDAGFGNLLRSPLTFNFSRADLDNDCGIELFVCAMKYVNPIRKWEKAQHKLRVQSIKTHITKSEATITVHFNMPGTRHLKTIITLTPQGMMHIEASLIPHKDMIRFGMTLGLDPTYASLSFYGKGPQENYCDRKHGSKLGLHQGNLEDFNHNYMRPQENGNHTEVRFLELSDDQNRLRFEATSPSLLETSVWPYTQSQLKTAKHSHELPPWTMTTVNLDYGQKGVAGDLPGFYMGPDLYKLKANRSYVYGFSLKISSLK